MVPVLNKANLSLSSFYLKQLRKHKHTDFYFLEDLPLEFVVLYRILLVHFPLYTHKAHHGRKWKGFCYKTSEELFSDGGNRGAVK